MANPAVDGSPLAGSPCASWQSPKEIVARETLSCQALMPEPNYKCVGCGADFGDDSYGLSSHVAKCRKAPRPADWRQQWREASPEERDKAHRLALNACNEQPRGVPVASGWNHPSMNLPSPFKKP